jgi:hypothetical protein
MGAQVGRGGHRGVEGDTGTLLESHRSESHNIILF